MQKITIITPSYNQGQYIERTIQSVLTQNVSNLEHIIMDGNSTDNTKQILAKYASVIKATSEKDKGQAHAVNKGLVKAKGEIIGWLNSDDIYYPEAITQVLNFFNEHPEVDVVYGQANHIDETDNIMGPYPTESWNVKRLTQTCYLCQPAVFFRRLIIDKYGLLNEQLNFCMDYEYWLRLGLQEAKFAYLPKVLAGSRLHNATKTLSMPLKANQEAVQMLKHKLGTAPRRWLINLAVQQIKTKTKLRSPQWRYIAAVWMLASYQAIKTNGLPRGLVDAIRMPTSMLTKNS